MSEQIHSTAFLAGDAGKAEAITEVRREAVLLKTGGHASWATSATSGS
jgi:hypothetical protein